MDEKQMTEITLSYLQSLDQRTEINELKTKISKIQRLIEPLQKDLHDLVNTMNALKSSKTQAIVEYYIQEAIAKLYGKGTYINWRHSNIQEGIIHCYNDYGHGDIDSFKVKLNEQLEIVK